MARGRFITFEGGEGAGKSTQLRRLAERLTQAGVEVVATREPGGSPGAESIRDLLVNGDADRWSGLSEALLMYAARRDHIERTITPALDRGAWVVCDRFADSTRAYQGAGGGVDPALISALESHVLSVRPDLTLILDLPADAGLARAGGRGGGEARFESKGLGFHERLRQAFLTIADAEPERCVVIDGRDEIAAVGEAVWDSVRTRLLDRG
ncbi:MAG: dTMP kinase [Phenylobacterium sp.]|uniref:dTMP kinase n=1 Tax=Phenylobacterium sp. TaxID=1871053 RepID=UPI002734BAF1|nr:dTMP kinase [Phenylobacterium sp.]MDP3173040.1 dTMP kinase [Phenylobacterium sp.]